MNPPTINPEILLQNVTDLTTNGFLSQDAILARFFQFLNFIKPFSTILSLFFLTGIIYCLIRIRLIIHDELERVREHHGDEHAKHDEHGKAHAGASEHTPHSVPSHGEKKSVNPRWEKISIHIASANQSDWRLAILECDIILDEMLTKMSYHGETLSDKLKAVEKSDFLTIDKAWEAHRVRNTIAHEGSNFEISHGEAERVIGLYEEVFKEFHYI